jgi:DNA-binding SARP family transcriptional activator
MQSLPEPLFIYLLGEIRLQYGGRAIAAPQRESLLRLFARLVLLSGQPQSRKGLAFSLWPDETESEALANLRRHLYLVRNFLPPAAHGLLEISPQTVCWQLSRSCRVDVFDFERESQGLDALERAVDLYRGDLAAGVDSDEFIATRREELRIRFLGLLKKLAQECFERGQYERALKWSRKLTAQDPWDEESVRLEMTIEALAGNRAAAISTYQALAAELQRELATQPMPETMALYSDILNNRLLRAVPRKRFPSEPVFVSREHELGQLADLLESLAHGRGAMVFISGDSGVGKTSFLQEALRRFMDSVGEEAPRLFWGHCQPPVGDTPPRPYAPWRQVFTAAAPLLARSAEFPPEWLNRLLPLAPDLSLLRPGLLAPSQPDADELRAALRQGLNFLAMTRPLILVVEDIHWADPASLELLLELADTCQTLPLLLLLTHRVSDAPLPLLESKRVLRRQRCAHEIPLQSFTAEETRLFLENMLGREVVTPALQDEITRYAQGFPLLLREAAESLRKAQASRQSLPTLRDSIGMRLGQLNGEARQMLEAAAVLGFSFSNRELESLLNWQASDYASALDVLQARRFLLDSASPGLDDYTFSHQLIHQIILGEIPSAHAVLLHEKAALALENAHAGQAGFAAEIAVHYEAARQSVPAARFWLAHAQELGDLAAFGQAEEAIGRALALVGNIASRECRELAAQAALLRGVLAHYRGQAAQALPLLESALAACREFPSLHANALARQAYALYTCDRYQEAHHAASQSLEIARALHDSPATIRALNIRGVTALMMGHTRAAIQDLQEALAAETGDSRLSAQTVQSLNHLGTALVFVQEYAQAVETLTKTVDLAQRGGLKRLEAAALTMLGQISLNQGRYSEAIRVYSQSIDVAGASYLPGMWGKFAGRGAAFLRMGNLEKARNDFERGLQIARQVESRYGQLLMQVYLALTSLAGGRAPDDSLFALEAEAAALDLHAVVLLSSTIRAGLWRLLGDFEQANMAHGCSVQAAQASGVPQFVQSAQLDWLLTQSLGATPDLAVLEALSGGVQASGEVPQQSLARLVLAASLAREQRPAEALTAAQQAWALARACPDLVLSGEALTLLIRLHESLGDFAQAQACRAELVVLAETAYAPFHLALDTASAPALRQAILKCVTA